MATHRTAEVTWQGSLIEGSGTIDSTTSGVLAPLPVTWTSRAEDPQGRTSPEDLLAAAHASCFAMALSGTLADAGYPPDELRTSATVTFVPGTGITKSALRVHGRVPRIDEDAFREAAEGAKAGCPISQALAGVPEITLDAQLED
jgi:osmotically inducible protein OsmC